MLYSEIDRLAEQYAAVIHRLDHAEMGLRHSTEQELKYLLDDPLGGVSRDRAEALREMAWDDTRKTVPRRVARLVRAFLRIVDGYHERSVEIEDAEQAAGWPTVANRYGYLNGTNNKWLSNQLQRLGLYEDQVRSCLKVWDLVYDYKVHCYGDTRYSTYLTLLFGEFWT